MPLSYETLNLMRRDHPSWRLLCAEHAPLIASFLHRIFVEPNVRVISEADLAERLEDELFALHQLLGPDEFPKTGMDYLNDWASPHRGWLRKFYPPGSDEPFFDLTPATEKAIVWLTSLTERSFVGTESRLLTLLELLRQMSEGSETDPAVRIAELHKRRDEIDGQIARVLAGEITTLGNTALKDRFQQFVQLARELLSDFREVEHNFRNLDRRVRERIALWEGGKGALLQEIMGERDAIADSDQGRSFRAFWDFLMSSQRQEELTRLLDRVLSLTAITELKPDTRIRRVHYDWLEAGEHTQRTVAELSKQFRRFLDDKTWLENRRIMDILHNIETRALALRFSPPSDAVMSLAETACDIELPLERPLFTPALNAHVGDIELETLEDDIDASPLFSQMVIDKPRLIRQIRRLLQEDSQVTLQQICEVFPLQQGLAELVTYLQLASDEFKSVVDEKLSDTIVWRAKTDSTEEVKQARLPRVIFVR